MIKSNSSKKAFQTRAFRRGGYSLLITAAVVVIAILINALLSSLPSSVIKPSISPYDYYSLTDTTRDLVASIDDKITLNYIVTAGSEDEVMVEFARRYCDLSKNLTLKFVDPTVSPAFVDKYQDLAGGELTENSIVVVNETSSDARIVAYEKVFGRTFASQEEYMMYMMGYDAGTKYFAGENEMTSALEYVTMEVHPIIYVTSGHGETEISDTLKAILDADNYDYETLNLLTVTEIPAEYSIVYVNAPSKDFTEAEAALLKTYMSKGGKVMLMTDYANGNLPNLYGIMEEYGMRFKEGIIVEGNANRYNSQPTILMPNVTSSSIAEKLSSTNLNFLMPLAHAIDTSTSLDTTKYTMTVLMNTSNAAYIKVPSKDNPNMTSEKEEGDETGVFTVACMTQNNTDGGTAVWFSSPWFADSQFLSYNYEYLIATFSSLTGKTGSISIATKTLSDSTLVVSSGAQGLWGIILIGLIPLSCLGYGLYIWNKRRKQ